MDITLPKNTLSSLLSRAASVAAAKSPQTMLQCIVLEAAAGKLTARATNLMLGVELSAPCEIKTPGAVAIDAKRAAEVAKSMPAGEVRLRVVKNQLEVSAGRSKFKLGTFPADEFPPVPTADKAESIATVEAAQLARIINQTAYAMHADESRAEHALLFACAAEDLRSFATDGKRLATSTLAAACAKTCNLVLPARAVSEIRKFAESAKDKSVTISRHSTNISNAFFATEDAVLSVKLADDSFPPVHKVFSNVHGNVSRRITLPREMTLDAITRVSICAEKAGDALKVSLDFSEAGELRVHSASSTADEGEDVVQCNSSEAVGFDIGPSFLTDILRAMTTDEVEFGLDCKMPDAVVPMISGVGSNECTGICMPMRRA